MSDDMSILIIRGRRADIVDLRRLIHPYDREIHSIDSPPISDVIFHQGKRNKWVPKPENGYEAFNELFEIAMGSAKAAAFRLGLHK